jgi:inner membrane protein
MHIPTHLMSGWCASNVLALTARERLFGMVAATAADVDGVSRLFGQEAYWDYHHVVGHNLAFALVLSGILSAFSSHRLKAFVLYLALAHLHLLLDYFGSGPGWPIEYGWPFTHWTWRNPDAWEFTSWQNQLVALGFLLWVLAIALVRGRTPVELLTPSLDRRFVAGLRKRVGIHYDKPAGPASPPS